MSLSSTPLVAQGILAASDVSRLLSFFFEKMHFALPLVPTKRKPSFDSEQEVAAYLHDEPYLATALLTIASRHDRDNELHGKLWARMQVHISDMILGRAASIGAVEALLLLSGASFRGCAYKSSSDVCAAEYLPKQPGGSAVDLSADENRMSWMLVGTAVRMGYMLGESVHHTTVGPRG